MARRKDVSRFIAIVGIILMHVTSPTAAVTCVWCDPIISQNFVNCVHSGLLNSRVFTNVPIFGLDDMRNSMIAASSAIKRSSDSMKMKMMNGAMAGELAELIKSQSVYQSNEIITREIMQIIGNCFVQYTGQSHVSFINELVDTVNFMLKEPEQEPKENERNFIPFSPPPQNPVQTSTSSLIFRSNINNQPPINGLNNSPQQQGISTVSGSSSSSFLLPQENNRPSFVSSPLRRSNSFGVPQSSPVTPLVSSQGSAGAISTSQTNFRNNAPNYGPNPLNQQPKSAGIISGSSFYEDYDDYASDYEAPDYPVVKPSLGAHFPNPIHSNDFVSNTNYAVSNSNYAISNTNYVASNANRISSLNNPISNEQDEHNQNVADDNAANSDRNAFNIRRSYGNPQANGNYASLAASSSAGRPSPLETGNNNQPGVYSYESVSSGSSASASNDQDNSYFSSNFNILNSRRNNLPRVLNGNNNQPGVYSVESASARSAANIIQAQDNTYPSNNFNLPNSRRNNFQREFTNREKSPNSQRTQTTNANFGTKNNGDSNQQNASSKGNDDAVAKATRFSKTIFVSLSNSDIFNGIFNSFISNSNAVSIAYDAVVTALNECGYFQYSGEVANTCVNFIKAIAEKSSSDKYGEAFSKSLMSQFYNKQLISEYPEDQARYITSSILTKLSLISSTRSSNSSNKISSDSSIIAANKKNNTADSNKNSNTPKNNSSSSEKRRSAMATRFYKTLCKRLQKSPYFRYIFNRKTSKAKAKNWARPMLRHSFKSDYKNKLARETANECTKRISVVPAHSRTPVYFKNIAECLTDVFFYYDIILLDNPISQATNIAANIDKWLGQALKDKDQSTTITAQSTDCITSQSTDYSTPQSIDYSTPQSIDYSTPQSEDYSTPQSKDYSTPQSNDYSTPQSTDYATPRFSNDEQDYYQDIETSDCTDQQISDRSASAVASSDSASNVQSNVGSRNTNDNNNYPFYDTYSYQQSDAKSGSGNDYLFLYDDDYKYEKQPQRNSANSYNSNGKPNQNQKNYASSKAQNNGRKEKIRNSPRNSNAESTANGDTPADDTQSQNDYQHVGSNNNGNLSQSKQAPSKILKSEKSALKDRIKYLMKVIPSYISNGKFDYKQFSKVIVDLGKSMIPLHKNMKSENISIEILIECFIASIQLLIKAQSRNFNTKNENFKNADRSNFSFSSSTSDSPEQKDQGAFSRDQTDNSQPRKTYPPRGESRDQTMPSQQQENSRSQSIVFQSNFNSIQPSQQNSYTAQDRPNAQSLKSDQFRTTGIQPQAEQGNWNAAPRVNENKNPFGSEGILIPNAQTKNFDNGSQYRQNNINSVPQRTQNIYPFQGESLNANSALGQGQRNWNQYPATQAQHTNINLSQVDNRGQERMLNKGFVQPGTQVNRNGIGYTGN